MHFFNFSTLFGKENGILGASFIFNHIKFLHLVRATAKLIPGYVPKDDFLLFWSVGLL